MIQIRVGIVGLGKMGSAFARRLLAQGHQVSVWNRSPQAMAAFNAPGGVPYVSLDGLISAVDVIIVTLWDDDAARDVTLKQIIPAMGGRQLLIEMSTLSPDMYDTLERATQAQGIDFVAAPILGNPEAVSAGSATVLAGGTQQAVLRARSILMPFGNVTEMKSVRASGYLKLANNTVLGIVAESLGELFEVCDRAGIDRRLAVESLTGAFERVVRGKQQQLLDSDTKPRFTLSALLKDLHLSQDAARALQVSTPVLQAVVPEAENAVDSGLGDRDYIALALEHFNRASASA